MTDKEEKDLIKRRASYKGRLTVFSNYLSELKEPLTQAQYNELQLRLGKIEHVYNQYDEIQLKLECMAEDVSTQLTERTEFESAYFKLVARAQDILAKQNEVVNSDKCSRVSNNQLVKLPTIQLPKFNGKYDKWLEFRDTFSSLIHSNDNIDEINKFHYLRACLEGTAAVVIQSIEFSASNYSIAWNVLCERFDNTRLLIHNHVAALFNMETCSKESSDNLKRIIDTLNKNLRSLESLGEPVSYWDTLLLYLITTYKFDPRTYRQWEEEKGRIDKSKSIKLENLLDFLKNRADFLETIESGRSQSNNNSSKSKHDMTSNKHKTLVSVNSEPSAQQNKNKNSNSQVSCPQCKDKHNLFNCPQFLGFSNEKRLKLLPEYKVCFNCFRSGHYANHCRAAGCKICKRKHNTMVHVASAAHKDASSAYTSQTNSTATADVSAPENIPSTNVTLAALASSHLSNKSQVLLATALLKVYDKNNREHLARAILDTGSTTCIMTDKLRNQLNLPTVQVNEAVQGINNSKSQISKMCSVSITSLSENFSTNLYCFILPCITDEVPCQNIPINNLNIPSDICLADPHFYNPASVDLIIGADVFWDILGRQKINLGKGKPILFESRLGWLVSGPLINSVQVSRSPSTHKVNFGQVTKRTSSEEDIQTLLSRFWELEEVSHQSSSYSNEEAKCEEHFVHNTTRLADGRFCVRIPLKQSPNVLGDSLARANRCLLAIERRFKNQPNLKPLYCEFMKEYISLQHMTECSIDSKLAYFIPHHGVLREASITTKLRVVFNASSVTTSGISSNNLQMVGPVVQDDLMSILLRFRKHKYIISADVEKMYRQVIVHPDDRYLQRILWRENTSDPIKPYELNTVTYGTASAPFLATRCLKQIGLECRDETIANIIIHDFYVDDLLTGGDSKDDVLDIRKKITAELASAQMPLRKWKSNNKQIISDQATSLSVNLNIGGTEPSKTLGLNWLTDSDELCFSINSTPISNNVTKREVLSITSQIFDPLGILAPCVIPMKVIMQKLWLHKLSWDDCLPADIAKTWKDIVERLFILNSLRIPRLVLCNSWKVIDLHIFCDASQTAYGACIYVRSVNTNGEVLVRLLTAKSRVAPIKPTTIPRLELCAALVGVRLYDKVIHSLNAAIHNSIFWSDSTIVLGWLKMIPSKLQSFVRNRVAEIVEKTCTNCTWRHVPTHLNPADLISRGTDVGQIQTLDLWWSGPNFLNQDTSDWPPSPTIVDRLPETKTEVSLLITSDTPLHLIDFNRFSNFSRMIRAVAYMLRFINICKKQKPTTLHLSEHELQNALNLLVKLSQMESFPEYDMLIKKQCLPKGSPLNKLNVFLDKNKLIRVGGRLQNSSFSYDKKHPFVIQSTHRFSKLLFEFTHKNLMHAGPQLLLATIRDTYWPIGGRNLAKLSYHRCIICSRLTAKPIIPIMGNLPEQRVTPGGHPFECVGVDYAGPILSASRQGRGCRLVKVYILLFICFTTKAVHIELVGDLTSHNYLSALRRFMSRRGKPSYIYSDNGTSFVGAYNELGKFLKENNSSLSGDIASEGINFSFIPPYAPHFGGLWEAGIKSVKYHLKRVMGNCHLTYEELYTALVQIEALLNSRPLTPLSSDPNDLLPLTPGHFLIGRTLTSLPGPPYKEASLTHLKRYERIEALRQHFWSRWNKEYISELQQRTKWRSSKAALEIDRLVVIKEDNLPPLKWRLGRISSVFPGPDGIIRVADIRTTTGVIRRACSKICPLPLNEVSG